MPRRCGMARWGWSRWRRGRRVGSGRLTGRQADITSAAVSPPSHIPAKPLVAEWSHGLQAVHSTTTVQSRQRRCTTAAHSRQASPGRRARRGQLAGNVSGCQAEGGAACVPSHVLTPASTARRRGLRPAPFGLQSPRGSRGSGSRTAGSRRTRPWKTRIGGIIAN